MQLPGPVIIRQPGFEKGRPTRRVAGFEKPMDALMRRMGVPRIFGKRTLDQPGPDFDCACFDIGPPEIAEKPPILAPRSRQFLEQRQLGLVMIQPSAEPEKTEHAECKGQRQRVPRKFRCLGVDDVQCLRREPSDRKRDRIDVPFLAHRDTVAQRLGPHRCRPRLGHSRLQLQQAGICDVRERKIGVVSNGAPQTLLGAGVRRQQQIDRRHIIADSLGGG